MIPVKTKIHVSNGHDIKTKYAPKKMTVNRASDSFVMRSMETSYSDMEGAIIREYSTNARDAHLEAGVKRPIEITSPTMENPNLIFKDYGNGMSADFLYNMFNEYFFSTKREELDKNGMFGIGSKSALGEVDTFFIESICDGMKSLARIYKDADNDAAIEIVSVTETDEHSGTKVIINVGAIKAEDYSEKIRQFFYMWPKEDVLVDGASVHNIYEDDMYYVPGYGHISNSHHGYRASIEIVMGDIRYKIVNLTDRQKTKLFSSFPKIQYRKVFLQMPLGSLELPTSREGIINHAKNLAVIERRINEMYDYLKSEGLKNMAILENPWDAMVACESLVSLLGHSDDVEHPKFNVKFKLTPTESYWWNTRAKNPARAVCGTNENTAFSSSFENIHYVVYNDSDDDYDEELSKAVRSSTYYIKNFGDLNECNRMIHVSKSQYELDSKEPLFNEFVKRNKVDVIFAENLISSVKEHQRENRKSSASASGDGRTSSGYRSKISYMVEQSNGGIASYTMEELKEMEGKNFYLVRASINWYGSLTNCSSEERIKRIAFTRQAGENDVMIYLDPKSSLEYFMKRVKGAFIVNEDFSEFIDKATESYVVFDEKYDFARDIISNSYNFLHHLIIRFVRDSDKNEIKSEFLRNFLDDIAYVEKANDLNRELHRMFYSYNQDNVFPEQRAIDSNKTKRIMSDLKKHYGFLASIRDLFNDYSEESKEKNSKLVISAFNDHFSLYGDPKLS